MLYGLYMSMHIMWTTLTVFQILSPFYVGLVPFITFQLKKDSFNAYKSLSVKDLLTAQITATPLVIPYLFTIDLIFIFNTLVIQSIMRSI